MAPRTAVTNVPARALAPVVSVRREIVEARLLDEAARLFAERGYETTTIQDIARRAGMSRQTAYRYVASKEVLLGRLVSELADGAEQAVRDLQSDVTASAPERLRTAIRVLALRVASSPDRHRMLFTTTLANVPAAEGVRHLEARAQVVRMFSDVIAEGVRAGYFRPVEPDIATRSLFGLCNWVAWWYEVSDNPSPSEVAEQIAEMGVASLLRRDAPASSGDCVEAALGSLRHDVERLAFLLASPPADGPG